MKILVISSLFPPNSIGGAEVVAHDLAGLFAEEHETVVVTTGRLGVPSKGRIRQTKLGRNLTKYEVPSFNSWWLFEQSPRPLKIARKVAWRALNYRNPVMERAVIQITKKERPDIIHTHNLEGFGGSLWTRLARHAPVVHTLHDFRIVCRQRSLVNEEGATCRHDGMVCRFHRRLWRGYANSVSCFVAPSKFIGDIHVRELAGGVPTRHIPNPMGVSTGRWKGQSRKPAALFVGRIAEHKGSRVLGEIILGFAAKPDWSLTIIGSGPDLDRLRATAHGIQNVVVRGHVSNDEKMAAFWRSNVLLFPSTWPENAPLTVLEGLATGNVVIAGAVGGVPEIVRSRREGIILSEVNAANYIAALDWLEAHPNEFTRMQKASMKRVGDFAPQAIQREYLQLFNSLIQNKSISGEKRVPT